MLSTVYILWLRQIKRYIRSRSRLIGSLGQPTLFLFGLGFGFGPIYARAGGGNYIQFLAPGIIAMTVLFNSMFNGVELIWDRQFGFLKETLAAPVSRFSIVLGRTLGGATAAVAQGIIVFFISLLAGFKPVSFSGVCLSLLFMTLIAIVFTSLGTAIASLLTDFHGFQMIMSFIIMPLFFLSGSMFPLEQLSGVMKTVTTLNPLSFGVDGLRTALSGISYFSVSLDLVVLGLAASLFLGLGSVLFNRIEV